MRSRTSEQSYVSSIAPAAVRNATTTGSTIDLLGFNSATIVVVAGVVTDGSYQPSVLESDDDSSYTAVDASDLDGTFVPLTTGLVQTAGYLGSRRYVQVKLVKTGGSTGAVFTAGVLVGDPQYAPVS